MTNNAGESSLICLEGGRVYDFSKLKHQVEGSEERGFNYRGLNCVTREGTWYGFADRHSMICFLDSGVVNNLFGKADTLEELMTLRDQYYRDLPQESHSQDEHGYLYRGFHVFKAKRGPYWFTHTLEEMATNQRWELEHIEAHLEYEDVFRAIDKRFNRKCDLCDNSAPFYPSHDSVTKARIFICKTCNEVVGRWNGIRD